MILNSLKHAGQSYFLFKPVLNPAFVEKAPSTLKLHIMGYVSIRKKCKVGRLPFEILSLIFDSLSLNDIQNLIQAEPELSVYQSVVHDVAKQRLRKCLSPYFPSSELLSKFNQLLIETGTVITGTIVAQVLCGDDCRLEPRLELVVNAEKGDQLIECILKKDYIIADSINVTSGFDIYQLKKGALTIGIRKDNAARTVDHVL